MALFSAPVISSAAAPPVTAAFTASSTQNTGLTVYTYSSEAIGAADTNRKIVVTILAGGLTGRNVSTVTVGGISATLVKKQLAVGGERYNEMWQADVPTGTTADVVVTWSAVMERCGIGIFAVYDAASAASATASDTSDPMNASINVPAEGVLIGGAIYNSAGGAATWTNLTESYETDSGGNVETSGYDTHATIQTGLSVTCDPASAAAVTSMVLASWGPA
jgi:hypothetical protein